MKEKKSMAYIMTSRMFVPFSGECQVEHTYPSHNLFDKKKKVYFFLLYREPIENNVRNCRLN